MYEVIVLKEGYNISDNTGHQKACGSITLLKGPQCIIVDTGNPWDKDIILEGQKPMRRLASSNSGTTRMENFVKFKRVASSSLDNDISLAYTITGEHSHEHQAAPDPGIWLDRDQGLSNNGLAPENINYCICTHGHSDHVGNLNLFSNAIYIVSYDVCVGDQYVLHDFPQGIPYEIDEDVEVIPTPGHTGSDVSVLVKNTKLGTVAVTGDLFECMEDLDNPHLWQDNSEQPQRQERSRVAVLRKADFIIPGHGAMFQVPDEYKKQLRVVMVYEESVFANVVTSRDYVVWEVGED